GNSFSREVSVSFFESSRAARLSSRFGPSTQAATTNGPAHAPRPTSSTPATGPRPLRYSADSRVRRPDDLRITVRGGQVVAMLNDSAADSPNPRRPTATAATR